MSLSLLPLVGSMSLSLRIGRGLVGCVMDGTGILGVGRLLDSVALDVSDEPDNLRTSDGLSSALGGGLHSLQLRRSIDGLSGVPLVATTPYVNGLLSCRAWYGMSFDSDGSVMAAALLPMATGCGGGAARRTVSLS